MYKGPCDCEVSCNRCRIGCFKPARHKNPFFGKEFYSDKCWWRACYSYAEDLCAECYDHMVDEVVGMEEAFSGEDGYEEDPEFTRILKTL